MKTIVKTQLPACDMCSAVALYDAPTVFGPWANMCADCFADNACPRRTSAGYKFTTEATPETDRAEEIALAIEMGDIDLAISLAGDSDISEYL